MTVSESLPLHWLHPEVVDPGLFCAEVSLGEARLLGFREAELSSAVLDVPKVPLRVLVCRVDPRNPRFVRWVGLSACGCSGVWPTPDTDSQTLVIYHALRGVPSLKPSSCSPPPQPARASRPLAPKPTAAERP